MKNLKWRKISYRLGENTYKAGGRIYIRVYKAFLKLNNKETIKLENGSRKWTYISLKTICSWQISKSTSSATREMQIKTTIRYHYILSDWQNQKISDNIKCWWGCRETGSPILLVGIWNRTTILQNYLTAYQPEHALITSSNKSAFRDLSQRNGKLCTWMLIRALFIIAKN